jgi:hypothetical protein
VNLYSLKGIIIMKKSFGIDDYINKDLKKLGKEKTDEKKVPSLTMLRYLISPRRFTQEFDKANQRPNRVDPVSEFVMEKDCYNLVYVLFNHDNEIWRLYTTTESQETVDKLRDNQFGRIENICSENYHAVVRLRDDHEKIKELADFKVKYKQNIPFHHLELDFAAGVKKFVGKELN